MNKTRVLIVEDEMLIALGIRSMLGDRYHCRGIVAGAEEAKLLLDDTDVALVDITLKGELTELDLADYINECYGLPIIFITALTDKNTVEKIVQKKPSAYLSKPIIEANLLAAIDIAVYNRDGLSTRIKIGKMSYIIHIDQLLYAESEHVYTKLFFTGEKSLILRISLKELMQILPENTLYRVNRSVAVNPKFIERMSAGNLYIAHRSFRISRLPEIRNELQQIIQQSRTKR